jgi:hypothetical protein
MRAVYTLLLRLSELELAIARSTDRRRASIAALSADCERWKRAIWEIDIKRAPL